jgi:hypothetical protein
MVRRRSREVPEKECPAKTNWMQRVFKEGMSPKLHPN